MCASKRLNKDLHARRMRWNVTGLTSWRGIERTTKTISTNIVGARKKNMSTIRTATFILLGDCRFAIGTMYGSWTMLVSVLHESVT